MSQVCSVCFWQRGRYAHPQEGEAQPEGSTEVPWGLDVEGLSSLLPSNRDWGRVTNMLALCPHGTEQWELR